MYLWIGETCREMGRTNCNRTYRWHSVVVCPLPYHPFHPVVFCFSRRTVRNVSWKLILKIHFKSYVFSFWQNSQGKKKMKFCEFLHDLFSQFLNSHNISYTILTLFFQKTTEVYRWKQNVKILKMQNFSNRIHITQKAVWT